MKIGAENKKQVYWLTGLGLVAAYMVYSNLISSPSTPSAPAAKRNDITSLGIPEPGVPADVLRSNPKSARPGSRSKNNEFHPVLVPKNPADQIDVRTVDPTLRLDLLAKVQQVPPAGGERDLFQILKSPPVKESALAKVPPEPKLYPTYGPSTPPPPPPPPPPPVDPPIPLKYYGFCTEQKTGKKTAFFMDNDVILQATEGSTLKGRYKVVQIRLTEVVMEDVQNKRQQSLKAEEVTSE